MEWYEIIGLVICLVIGAFIRDYVYRNKYKGMIVGRGGGNKGLNKKSL